MRDFKNNLVTTLKSVDDGNKAEMLSPQTHRKSEKELQDYCSPLCPCVLPRNLAGKTWDPEGGQGKVLGDLP